MRRTDKKRYKRRSSRGRATDGASGDIQFGSQDSLYQNLANAIIEQAVEDWRAATYYLQSCPENEERRLNAEIHRVEDELEQYENDAKNPEVKRLKKMKEKTEKNSMKIRNCKASIRECETFFHSSWFAVLTTVDPDWLLDKLKLETAC